MQGSAMQQEFVLNESFKALLESIFSNPEQSKKLMHAFEEVVNDRATTQRLNLENIKQKAVDEVRQEIVTKDFVEAKILESKLELKEEISELKTKGLYWLLGTAVVSAVTILSGVWAMMSFMLSNLK